jgi:hypothetical protein
MPKKRRNVRYARLNAAQPNLVLREVDYIVARAAESCARVVTLGQLVFFSTETGDAWLLDPEDRLALCLARDGSRLPIQIVETVTRFAIEWNAWYKFEDDAFIVTEGPACAPSLAIQLLTCWPLSAAPPDKSDLQCRHNHMGRKCRGE